MWAAGFFACTAVLLSAAAWADDAGINSTDASIGRQGPLRLLNGQPMNGELRRVEGGGSVALLPVRQGLLEGMARSRYADGQPRSEGAYARGQPHGLHRAWWPSGQLQSEQNFVNGMPHGLSRTWYASGKRYEEHRHEHGQEAGLQRIWFEDQRLRANYEVKHGRRYGSIGSMGCVGGDRAPTETPRNVVSTRVASTAAPTRVQVLR
jgi:hypothetical protein